MVGIAGGDGRYLEMGRLADGCCVVLARIEWAAQLDGPPYRRSDTGGSAVVRVGDLPGRAVPPIAAATMMKVAFHFGGGEQLITLPTENKKKATRTGIRTFAVRTHVQRLTTQ